jgi:hypothetical protein
MEGRVAHGMPYLYWISSLDLLLREYARETATPMSIAATNKYGR